MDLLNDLPRSVPDEGVDNEGGGLSGGGADECKLTEGGWPRWCSRGEGVGWCSPGGWSIGGGARGGAGGGASLGALDVDDEGMTRDVE